jgi:hypothetical protein
VLPFANSLISTAQVIFSGNPSMTLKVSIKFSSWLVRFAEAKCFPWLICNPWKNIGIACSSVRCKIW